jgi:hypothetical protein
MNARRLAFSIAVASWAAAAQGPAPLFRADTAAPLDAAPFCAGDFDGDGDQDLLSPAGPLMNDGAGRFAYGPPSTLFTDVVVSATGDFDGDGVVDVILRRNATGATLHFIRGLGGAAFAATTATTPAIPATALEFLVVDVDSDGFDDVLTGYAGLSGVPTPPTYWRCTGAFNFADVSATMPTLVTGGRPARFVGSGDLDNDGDRDVIAMTLAVSGVTLGELRALYNDGTGALNSFSLTVVPQMNFALAVDVDGDGDLDVVGL